MTLDAESAVRIIAEAGAGLLPPRIEVHQVHKIYEVELRSGGRYVEVYAGVPWALHHDEPAPAHGVCVFNLEMTADGRWRVVSGSARAVASDRAEDFLAAFSDLEEQRTIFRPKAVKTRNAKPAKVVAVAPLSEPEGAGAWSEALRRGELPRVTEAEADEAERALGTRLPAGYRTFVITLGTGVFGGVLRVYPPARIVRDLADWRGRIERHWFWGESPLPQETAFEAICIADTVGGDEIVFHPSDPDALFLLPHERRARRLGRGLAAAVAALVRTPSPVMEPFGS